MASRELTRRGFVAAGVTGAALIGGGRLGSKAFAQDDATPTSDDDSVQVPATPVAAGPTVPPEMEQTSGNWVTENGDYAGTRNAEDSSISADTIDQLGIGWTMALEGSGAYGAMTAAPIVLDDMIFLQDMASNVTAVKKDTGDVVWHNDYSVGAVGPNGLAVGYGYLVFALGDSAEVVCVKQESGEGVWRVKLSNNMGEGVDMAPIIHDNTVYVSTVPGNTNVFYRGGQKGIIYALDITSGHTLWQFDTTADNLWGNARVNSGGGLWHPPAIDSDGDLYVGIGNAGPYPGNKEFPAGSSRPGDNDYANSLIKIDPSTGSVDWYINVKPHDLFDLDNQLTPVLAEVEGTPTVFTSGKHGWVVAANRDTGEEMWRTAVGEHKNDDLQELPSDDHVEVLPGTLGGVETPLAYADGVVFAPVFNMASRYSASELDPSSTDISKATGQLVALDAASGEILWDVSQPTGTLAGATVVNDLVFTGGLDGVIHAYSVDDGSEVWNYQTTAGLNAPLAVAGDWLFVPAAAAFIPSEDTSDPPPDPAFQLIAFQMGADLPSTPPSPATPESEATPTSG